MKFLKSQIVVYGIVGGVNTIVDLLVYVGVTRFSAFFSERLLSAAVIAFFIAGVVGYFLHKYFTFKDSSSISRKQIMRFYMSSGVGLTVNESVLWLLLRQGQHDVLSKLVASLAAAAFSFVLQKFWTFNKKTV